MRQRLHVSVRPETMDGVRVYIVTPDVILPEHRDKLLIHVHGGCYVLYPGESGTAEAIMMAGLGHFKVVSVDYRMPPEAYFPGALDDAMTVYKAALKTTDPKNIAVFGTSAGGALVLEMMLRAKQLAIPLPGAIAPGTPMADVTKTGDSFYTNEMVDNVLVSRDGFCDAATVVYAHGTPLSDPLLSPVYGDMHGKHEKQQNRDKTRDQNRRDNNTVHRAGEDTSGQKYWLSFGGKQCTNIFIPSRRTQ